MLVSRWRKAKFEFYSASLYSLTLGKGGAPSAPPSYAFNSKACNWTLISNHCYSPKIVDVIFNLKEIIILTDPKISALNHTQGLVSCKNKK